LLGQFYHIADSPFLHQEVFGDFDPKLLSFVLILRLIGIFFGKFLLVVLKGKSDCFSIEIHFAVDNNLSFNHLVILEKAQSEVKIKV
jgi:hypothetical protein